MKFRKSYFSALAVSCAVFIVVGIIALVLALTIPSSPWAIQWKFLAENHFSPAAFYSDQYQRQAPAVAILDFWVTLPVMTLAGAALGIMLAARASLLETFVYSVLTSLILAAVVLGMDWYITVASQSEALSSAGYAHVTGIDKRYLLLAGGNIVLWTILYSGGAIGGYIARRRLKPSDVNNRKGAKPRVASTAP